MKSRVIALLLLSLLVALGTSWAQNPRTGTAAATELLIPVGARDLAMGGSSIASSVGLEAIHWNPAGLGRMAHTAEGMFSTMYYLADIQVIYGAAGAKFGDFGTVGMSIKSLSFGDIPLTTVDDPEGLGGMTYSPTYVTFGLTYGRDLTDAISVGATAKVITERIDRVSSSGFAFDFGLQYNGLAGVSGLQLGVAVKNIGPQMQFQGSGLYQSAIVTGANRPVQQYQVVAASFELPSVVEVGLGYAGKAGDNMKYNVTGVYTSNSLFEDEYKIGGEYGFMLADASIFLRGGYNFVPQLSDVNSRIFGATLGAGLVYNAGGTEITVDYAYRDVKLFSGSNVISIKVGF